MLADHDDIVAPDALYEMVRLLNEQPDLDIVYTDEDKVSMDGRKFYGPNFKSDFNMDLLRSVNYICHIFLVKSKIAKKQEVFAVSLTERRIMILSSAVWSRPAGSAMSPKRCITGGPIRIPRRAIPPANNMQWMQEGKR